VYFVLKDSQHPYITCQETRHAITRAVRDCKLRQGQNAIQDSNTDFWINPDPYDCRIGPKMLWIYSLVSASHFAKYHKNWPVTVWEIPMKLVKSPIPQLWRKRKSDPKCTRESGSQPKVNHFQRVAPCPSLPYSRGSPFAQAYHVWLTKRPFPHSSVILLTEWQTDRTTNHTTALPE